MAAIRLDARIRGDEQLREKLDRLGQRAEHARPLFARLTRVIIDAERRRFRRRGGPPLSPVTRRIKQQRGYPPQPLVATGRTIRSLTQLGAPDQILTITDREMRFGTSVFHARFHHFGTKHEPRRRLIAPTRRDRDEIYDTFHDALMRSAGA